MLIYNQINNDDAAAAAAAAADDDDCCCFIKGGIKAVLWTDTFQLCMMFAGLIAVLVQGSVDKDGFGNIWKIMEKGQRLKWVKYVCHPTLPSGLLAHLRDSSAVSASKRFPSMGEEFRMCYRVDFKTPPSHALHRHTHR